MKKYLFGMIFLAAIIFTGCGLETLHPIFTVNDLVMDQRILGKWKKQGEDGVTSYQSALACPDEDIPSKLRAHRNRFYYVVRTDSSGNTDSRELAFLVKLGGKYFIDSYPLENQDQKRNDEFFRSHILKLHHTEKVEFNAERFTSYRFDETYIQEAIKRKQIRIDHTWSTEILSPDEKKLVITASTDQLQKFLVKYGSNMEAFEKEPGTHLIKISNYEN